MKHPGKYQKIQLVIGLSAVMIFLFTACSTTAIVEQPTPIPSVMDLLPTATLQTPSTLVELASQSTPPDNTATPLPVTPTVSPTVQPAIGSSRTGEVDGMVQVFVPAGEFLMGSTDPEARNTTKNGRAYPEIPQHTVYLDSYWIDKYEVTNSQYALCVDAGVCGPPWVNNSYTYANYFGSPEFKDYPIIWVTWYQARGYCEWAGRRLPTEAEWEKAARGTDGQKYPWGNEPVSGERANFCDINCTRNIANPRYDDGFPDTAPVGSFPAGASPYGAMDMSGNVWEWVSTLIQPYPYDAADGREDLDAPGERTWRGGPWSNGYWWMRSSVRYRSVPEYKWYVLGFRCASSK